MATPQEELMKMLEDMRTPGMTRTAPGTASNTRGSNTVSASFEGGTAGGVRQPGVSAGRSSVPTTNPAERLQRASRITQSPAQASRTSTEAALNPAVGESLRRSLIEQQRLRSNRRIPGSVNPVQFRAMMAEEAANQSSIDSGLAALQGIREGGIAERATNLEATTAIEDRQLQEAGAFDRALLGLDATMLEGQFGLADTAQRVAGARDPYADFNLDLMGTILDEAPELAPELLNVGRGLGALQRPTAPTGTVETVGGLSFDVPQMQAIGLYLSELPEAQRASAAQIFGLAYDDDGRLVSQQQALAQRRARAAQADTSGNVGVNTRSAYDFDIMAGGR